MKTFVSGCSKPVVLAFLLFAIPSAAIAWVQVVSPVQNFSQFFQNRGTYSTVALNQYDLDMTEVTNAFQGPGCSVGPVGYACSLSLELPDGVVHFLGVRGVRPSFNQGFLQIRSDTPGCEGTFSILNTNPSRVFNLEGKFQISGNPTPTLQDYQACANSAMDDIIAQYGEHWRIDFLEKI